ncbi:hypothetical protein ABZ468_42480 [Streptomyces sp. NPDC005708]
MCKERPAWTPARLSRPELADGRAVQAIAAMRAADTGLRAAAARRGA